MDKAKICMNRKYTSRLQLIKSIFFSIHSFEGCYCENHFFVEIFFYGIVVILLQVVLKLLRIRFSYQKGKGLSVKNLEVWNQAVMVKHLWGYIR